MVSLKLSPKFTNRFESIKPIFSLIVIGLLLRVVLGAYTSCAGDFEVWYITFIDLLTGKSSPYFTMYYSYPPVWSYVMMPFSSISAIFSNPFTLETSVLVDGAQIFATSPLFNVTTKFPIFIAELFIGLLIFDQVKKNKDAHMARKAFILWFLNPLVLLAGGAISGQMDAIASLFLVLAFIFFIEKRLLLCGASIAIGTLTKVFPIYLLPLYLFFVLLVAKKEYLSNKILIAKKFLINGFSLFAGLSLGALVCILPLLISGSLPEAIKAVLTRGGYVASIGGFSPFILARLFVPDIFDWFNVLGRPPLVYSCLQGIFLVSSFIVAFYYVFISKTPSIYTRFLNAHICVIVTLYLTLLVVNPQYLLWVFPFLIISYGLYGNYLRRIILLSIFGVAAQLFWVMHYFNPLIYFSSARPIGVFLDNLLVNFLDSVGNQLMFISSIIGLFIIITLYLPKLPISRARK